MEAHRGEALLLAGDACWTFLGLAAKGAYRQLGGASDAMDRLASSGDVSTETLRECAEFVLPCSALVPIIGMGATVMVTTLFYVVAILR